MNQIGSLAILLNLKTGGFTAGISRASGQLQTFAGQMGTVQRAASGMAGKLLALVGIGGGIAGIVAGIKQAAGSIDQLAKTADKLGIATEQLAGFRHAAELTGVSAQQADTALQRMVRRIAEAALGSGEAKKALAELGLSATELTKLSPDRQFRLIAEAMQGVGSQADRVRLAMRLFDSEGVALVNTLRLGAEGLDQVSAEAMQLGLAISRVDAAKVEAANDAMTRLRAVFSGIFNQLAVHLAPIIEAVAMRFVQAASAGESLGVVIGRVVDYGARGVGFLANSWQGLSLAFHAAQAAASTAMEAVVRGLDLVVRATEYWREVFSRTATLAGALWNQIGAGLQVMAQAVRKGFAELAGFIGSQLGTLLEQASQAAYVFDAEVGTALLEASFAVRNATNTMALSAERDFRAASAAAIDAAAATGQAWDALSQPIGMQGSATLQAYAEGLHAVSEEQWQQVDALRQERLASDAVWEGYERLKEQAQERAELAASVAPATAILVPSEDPALIAERERQAALEMAAQEHRDSLTGIYRQGLAQREQFAQQSAWAQTRSVLEAMVAATSAAASHSKTMFRIHKIASIGSATVSTAEGVSRALGAFPPPLNFAMAGLVGVAGAVQIAAIKNTQYGGGGSVPTVAASIPSGGASSGSGSESGSNAAGGGADAGQGKGGANTAGQIDIGGRTFTQQTLVVQGDFLRAEELERLSREAKERNVLITAIRRA